MSIAPRTSSGCAEQGEQHVPAHREPPDDRLFLGKPLNDAPDFLREGFHGVALSGPGGDGGAGRAKAAKVGSDDLVARGGKGGALGSPHGRIHRKPVDEKNGRSG